MSASSRYLSASSRYLRATPAASALPLTTPAASALPLTGGAVACLLAVLTLASVGCEQPEPIRQYTINTQVPAALRSDDRMLGAIIAGENQAWFLKLVGPAEAVDQVEPAVREFAREVSFTGGGLPDLSSLPPTWRKAEEKPMRFATLMIPAPAKELELSISQLPKSDNWDELVAMNINRWRGQMNLGDSEERWAGAEPLGREDAAGEAAVWIDLRGTMGPGPPPMSVAGGPFASGATSGQLPPGHPEISPGAVGAASAGGSTPRSAAAGAPAADGAENPAGLKYEAPPEWRKGKMSMMRLAAFEIGPEVGPDEQPAELTIIAAGGDLRGNVDRWIGQVRGGSAPSEVVDTALEDAEKLTVSGRDAQRFYLTDGTENPDAQAIDATIVPVDGGMSLFIKATGPAETLQEQRRAIGQFLESLTLPE